MNDQNNNLQEQMASAQSLLRKGRYADALACLPVVIEKLDPNHGDCLYLRAVCLRYLKQYDKAIEILSDLKNSTPEFGRAYQEEGHIYFAVGKLENAVLAYQRATQYNPALEASWRGQVDVHLRLGRDQQAKDAKAQESRIKALPKHLLAVTNYMHEGKIFKAEEICRQYLKQNPTDTEGMRLLAEIGTQLGILDDAEFLLESAIEFDPKNIQIKLDYIKVLRKRQKFATALKEAKHLYDLDPENVLFLSQLAVEEMQAGDYDSALRRFNRVLVKRPKDVPTLTSYGHALKTYGKQNEAISAYQKAYELKPDHGEAYYALANLKTYKFSDDEISDMEAQVKTADISHKDQVHFDFALGKAHEDRGSFQKSFEYYKSGNELKRIQARYTSKVMREEREAQMQECTPKMLEKQGRKGCPDPDPIFIVGLPRAGSTLLEQILASHSQIDGTLELHNILSLSHKLRGRDRTGPHSRYPKILIDLSHQQLREFGEQFIEDTRIHRQGAPFFIDKMPNNFRHIGLIYLILPNAKIIDARRHPMACCFSGFKQLFAEGQEFTYGLNEIGEYYRDYVALMDHWDRVLPGKVLRVQYEDVVADTETQVRRVLDYLGLPFEEACLEFHKTKRSVRTASSEQVRQPIFKTGLEQWRNFEPWLGPLKDALGPDILNRYPIE